MMFRLDLQRFAGEKTEPATPKRREESRKRGQVAKSNELGAAVLILAGFSLFRFLGSSLAARMQSLMRYLLLMSAEWEAAAEDAYALMLVVMQEVLLLLLPVLGGLALVAFLSQAVQVGFMTTWETLVPKFSRVNPLEGFKRIVSKRAMVEFAKSLAKISLIGYIAFTRIQAGLIWLPSLTQMETLDAVSLVGEQIFSLALIIGVTLLAVAILDYLYQRWEFEQSIRMSKQEIKDEHKQAEGDPQLRSKIRSRQREMASQRMMDDVPGADVVITNPTHIAIAVRYQIGEMAAPQVAAKGAGFMAERIRQVAEEHAVPIVENPAVARSLFQMTEIGEEIPAAFYGAVAEILAFVYRMKHRRAGQQ